ncbi:hypothetical protein TWF718_009136 [Orbilia javanica]|uniref:Protein kinase domain-containing protein n=1 Tax=Orbilia javanica TaxID=47235 RepID=A0AAN8RCD1_9PEZI
MEFLKRSEPSTIEARIPESVLKLKLETEFSVGCIKHRRKISTASQSGSNATELEEVWDIGPNIGVGASSSVRFEELRQNYHHDRTAPQYRAVKVVKKSYGIGRGWDYRKELSAIAQFSGPRYAPYFVHTHGWFENDDEIFIAMEFFPLGDLGKVIRSEPPLSETETSQIIRQVSEGVRFMHEGGFAHRDLKPNNILVWTRSPRWIVKLADFGICKEGVEDDTHLTEIGTSGYVAPEVLRIFPVTEFSVAIDIWAVGVITVELLLHRRLFRYTSDLLSYVRGEALLDLDSSVPHINLSASCRNFIQELLAPDPTRRPKAAAILSHQWITELGYPGNSNQVLPGGVDITMVSSPSGAFSAPSIRGQPQTVEMMSGVQTVLTDSTNPRSGQLTITQAASPMSLTTTGALSPQPTDLGTQSSLTTYSGNLFDRSVLLPAFREIQLEKAKYYVMRSTSTLDSETSIALGTWTSGPRKNKIVEKGYLQSAGNVVLIFSLVGSQRFYGVAKLASRVDWDHTDEHWEEDIWEGRYALEWICITELPFARVKNVPVSAKTPNWRAIACYDGTEISALSAYEILKAFSAEEWGQQGLPPH